MGGSKSKSRSKTKSGKSSKKKLHQENQKMDPKMLAIALIFVMLFVSFAVIITTQEAPQSSKNMVFYQDKDVPSTRTGNVRDLDDDKDLSEVRMEIRDDSADSTNSTDSLKDGTVLETDGGFNCTFFDKNQNNKLDDEDEFIVYNVATGDWVKLYLGSSDDELAYYIF